MAFGMTSTDTDSKASPASRAEARAGQESRAAEPLYLDYAAAAPLSAVAREAMLRAYQQAPANPSSISGPGRQAAAVLREARHTLAETLGVPTDRVLFTSGGTESNALAVLGALADLAQGNAASAPTGHVLLGAIEHPSVLESVARLERWGLAVTRVAPEPDGVIPVERFGAAARPDTRLACLMHVNNELGTIQPVAEALYAVRERAPRCVCLVDAVQSYTRLPVEPERWGADFVSLSGHKIGGPRGIGALVALRRRPAPLMGGGDQEWGARPGTENVPGAVAFAAAATDALARLAARRQQAQHLHDAFVARLAARLPSARIHGEPARRIPWILSVAVARLPSEALLRGMEEQGVVGSAGAACHARSQKQSHVLAALGVPRSTGIVRLSLGEHNTVADMEAAVEALARTAERYALP